MTLRLFNSLTRTKEDFQPLDARNVRLYVCGPTVYDYAHIGNARPAIVFDVLYRLLRHLYGNEHVTYVRNITDVDDKINARAARDYPDLALNEAVAQVTGRTTAQYHKDIAALGCLPPDVEPRATENIEQMIVLVQRLLDQRHAYVARGGEGREVLFDVLSMPDYGALSRRNLDEQIAGARVAVEDHKRNPEDFVLWKESDASEPGWDATFEISDENRKELGLNSTTLTIHGRPGWHLECSAMSERYLWTEIEGRLSGKARAHPHQFDIHGGGIDLIFPHHENEIAQTRCAFGTEGMAQVWMHNGFLQVEGQKMSKSLRNFVTIHELLRGWKGRAWSGSAVRWAMLQTQYRQPIDWTLDLLTRSAIEIIEIINLLRGCFRDRESGKVNFEKIDQALADYSPDGELVDALTDDLNTPDAMLAIREKKSSRATDIIECVGGLMFLGVLKESDLKYYSNFHGIATDVENREKILALVDDFQIARANNDVSFMASVSTELDKLGLQLKENEPSQLVIVRKVDITSVADFRKNVNELVDARSAARAAKNWGEADRIRNELAGMGIQLMDSKDPDSGEIKTTWEVKR